MPHSRRRADRSSYDNHTRIGLLETDADDFEAAQGRVWTELKRIRALATSTLAALVVAAVMLAINLGVS